MNFGHPNETQLGRKQNAHAGKHFGRPRVHLPIIQVGSGKFLHISSYDGRLIATSKEISASPCDPDPAGPKARNVTMLPAAAPDLWDAFHRP